MFSAGNKASTATVITGSAMTRLTISMAMSISHSALERGLVARRRELVEAKTMSEIAALVAPAVRVRSSRKYPCRRET